MFRADLFAGKRFLVTGGGTGLGRIMLEKFVELGADCVICGRGPCRHRSPGSVCLRTNPL